MASVYFIFQNARERYFSRVNQSISISGAWENMSITKALAPLLGGLFRFFSIASIRLSINREHPWSKLQLALNSFQLRTQKYRDRNFATVPFGNVTFQIKMNIILIICVIRGSVTFRQKQLTLRFLIYGLIIYEVGPFSRKWTLWNPPSRHDWIRSSLEIPSWNHAGS